jgi:4-amino-4-deoxy-L-arabinose transferase-like glycosyltransferase
MSDVAADPATEVRGDIAPINTWVYAVGGLLFAVLMAVSSRYGFQRDELYFMDAARHLSASYVDQPGFAPLLTRVSLALFGVSAPGLRVWPALAACAMTVIGGLTAREFGGGRRVQLLAAIGVATMPAVWGASHVANTTAYLFLAWAGLALVVARIGRTGEARWWLVGGLVAGLGMADNHLMAFFALAIVIGVLLSGGGRLLLNRWFVSGVAIAAACTVPDIWWQATHGWAAVAMTHALNRENGGAANIAAWVIGQFLLVALALIWVWVAGLVRLWRSGRPLWRALAWAYGLLYVLFAVTTGGKIYYLAGAYVYLLAAGAVAVDGWLHAKPGRVRGLTVGTALTSAVMALLILPILPPTGIGPRHAMDSTLAETVGWPQLVGTVRTVWLSLPPDQRADAVIFTADYSEAGAVNELGRGSGLPTAVSGQNSVWWWGPGNPDATTVVAVAPSPDVAGDYAAYLRRYFGQVREAATLTNPYGIHNIEAGGHVYICTGLHQRWGQLWPQLRHYD